MLRIRPATLHDAPLLCIMIRELAEFENELDLVTIQEEDVERDGFWENHRFRALIAELGEQGAGYKLFWHYYS